MQKTESKEFKGIVRLAGRDLQGELTLYQSLLRVKGIGSSLVRILGGVIEEQLKLDADSRIGDLSEEQLDAVENLIKNPAQFVPSFMVNRQKDPDSGEAKHLVMNDLVLSVRQDIEKEKTIKTWVGWRHSLGQKVRGQHNRTTGRTGLTVGVLKKVVKAQKAEAAETAQRKGEKPAAEKK